MKGSGRMDKDTVMASFITLTAQNMKYYHINIYKKGEWKNNIKEGYAIFTEDTGNILQGVFKDDRLLKDNAK